MWNDAYDSVVNLTDYRSKNSIVQQAKAKKVLGTTQREFLDKRIFFYKSEVKELEDGENDDIYVWTSSAPNELCPEDKAKFVRAETLFGLMRIGKSQNGGTYLHVLDQTDLKISVWTQKMLIPLAVPGLTDYRNKLNQHLLKLD